MVEHRYKRANSKIKGVEKMVRHNWLKFAIVLLTFCGPGCAVMQRSAPAPEVPSPTRPPDVTPVPTVPPRTATPVAAAPLPTRPIKSAEAEAAKKAGKAIGPIVTFAGTSRADGVQVEPIEVGKDGIPIFRNYIGSGFQLVIEGKPGIGNLEVGRRIFAHDPDDPKLQPDLQVQVTRALGDGSEAICDRRRPTIGGIPGIDPPSFKTTRKVSDAMNDLACRFETFIEPNSSCVVDQYGDFDFVKKDSTTQFCMVVAKAWNFPIGDTLVSVRLRDIEGNPGPVAQFVLRRPATRPTPERKGPTPAPTPPRRRP